MTLVEPPINGNSDPFPAPWLSSRMLSGKEGNRTSTLGRYLHRDPGGRGGVAVWWGGEAIKPVSRCGS